MSDLIDQIRQSAGQVLSDIDQKGQFRSAIDGIRAQWTEIERKRKVSSLERESKTMRTEMKQLAEALGLQTLSLYEAGKITHPELSRLCERIGELRVEIDAIKESLSELAEMAPKRPTPKTHCPLCKAEIEADTEFCPKCGAKLKAEPAAPAAPAASSPAPSVQRVSRARCPRCKTEVAPDAAFCPGCGAKFKRVQEAAAPASSYCPSCGAETKPDAQFCPICGHKMGN